MKQQISSKKVCIILFVMITLQVLFITNGYIHKKDYHSDEVWSFGLANSSDGPYIYVNDDETEVKNAFKWLSGDVIRDYVSVKEEDRFSYASVIYNLGEDQHPPLFYMIIHTISSIFPNTYTLWYGYIVNVIAFIITQIFMYKTVRDLSESKLMGICACLLWGFSVAAMSIAIFVRHYAVSVMFMLISCYYHTRLIKYKDYKDSTIVKIAIITFLGCMSNHYFTMCEFFIAAYTCVVLLIRRKYIVLIKYAVAQLGAVAIFLFVCFPAALRQMFGRSTYSVTMKKANYDYQFWCCLNYMFSEVFGIYTPIYGTMFWVYFDVAVMILSLVAIVCAIVFRNEVWFKRFVKNIVHGIRKWVYILKTKLKYFPVMLPCLYIVAMANLLIIAYMISVPLMAEYTDRYLFVSFPLIFIAIFVTLYYVIKLVMGKKNINRYVGILTLIGIILIGCSHVIYKTPYLFEKTAKIDKPDYLTNKEVDEYLDGNDCIIGYDEYWCLTMAPEYAYKVDNFFAFPLEYYEALPYFDKPENDNEVYLFCDIEDTKATTEFFGVTLEYDDEERANGINREHFMNVIKQIPYVEDIEYLGYTYSFGRYFELYKLK